MLQWLFLRRLDQFPKLRILLQRLVFVHFDAGPEQKVLQRMPAENAMHYQAKLMPFEIDAVIANAKSLQNPPSSLEFPELIDFCVHDLLRQAAKFTKDLQLQLLRHSRQFGSARRVKNDLERAHLSARSLPELPFRTSWKYLLPSESACPRAQHLPFQSGKRSTIIACPGTSCLKLGDLTSIETVCGEIFVGPSRLFSSAKFFPASSTAIAPAFTE